MSSSIHFIIEFGNNPTLQFHDIYCSKEKLAVTIIFWRLRYIEKSTSSGQYINFKSNSLLSHKIAVIRLLYNRVSKFCNDKVVFNNKINKIFYRLHLKDSSRRWCHRIVSEIPQKSSQYPIPCQQVNPKGTISLPYYSISEKKICRFQEC